MGTRNEKEKKIRRNKIKIWVFGIITLILILVAVSLLMLSQEEMVTSIDMDGSTFYVPNENAVNYFASKTMVCLVIIPLAVVFLITAIIYFCKNIRLRKT